MSESDWTDENGREQMPIMAFSGVVVFFALLAAIGAAIYAGLRVGVPWLARVVRETWRQP
jgi:hypothetical protein